MPVAADEAGHTRSVSIYYVPVNVNGRQYSARMVVKELENRGRVVDELSLYNVSMHKEKAPQHSQLKPSEDGGSIAAEPNSEYKITELIHNSQAEDKKIVFNSA